jgi:drug/metabolite transporter (DMT)-like permease
MSANGNEQKWQGIAFALAAAVLFGASTPVSKLLLGQVNPWLLAGILYLGAGFGLLIYQLASGWAGKTSNEAPLRRSDVPWIVAVVFFGGMAGPVLLMLGLAQTNAASASLLLNLEGIATMVIAWVVFRENVDRRLVFGALAIVAGAVLLSWKGNGFALDRGGVFVALACLAWGIDNNLTRKLSSSDPVQLVVIKGLVAGAANVGIAMWQGSTMPSFNIISAGAVVGLLGIGISLVCFMLGLRHLGTARTGAYFSLAPFIGAVLAIVLLGDSVTANLVAAAMLMAVGLYLHLSERHEHDHTHEEMEHEHAHTHDVHHTHAHDGLVVEPHSHWHRHAPIAHKHPHYPDLHHRHTHG